MNTGLPELGRVTTETIDGISIRLARCGAETGVPVLFTSPWPESIYTFHNVLPSFANTRPVVAIDLPGFGLSESRSDVMSPRAMGAFLVKALAFLNFTRVHGVGPDVGALAFLFAAVDRPDLFETLAVGGAATRMDLAGQRLRDIIDSPEGAFSAIDGSEAVSGYLTEAARITPPAVVEDFRRASAGRRFENAAQYVRAYKTDLPRLEDRLAHIETPVLVIAGKNDPIVPPPNNQLLADRLPRHRLSLLEAGHRVWAEATQPYASEILSWIEVHVRA